MSRTLSARPTSGMAAPAGVEAKLQAGLATCTCWPAHRDHSCCAWQLCPVPQTALALPFACRASALNEHPQLPLSLCTLSHMASSVLQLAQKELALLRAMSARFVNGSHARPLRDSVEAAYAVTLEDLGHRYSDPQLLAMAAEALTNLHQWDYYQVRLSSCSVQL